MDFCQNVSVGPPGRASAELFLPERRAGMDFCQNVSVGLPGRASAESLLPDHFCRIAGTCFCRFYESFENLLSDDISSTGSIVVGCGGERLELEFLR